MTSTELPNDIDSLKKLVIQEHELRLLEHQRAELFKYRLEKLTRKHYGSSSEKIHEPDGQQLLFALPQPEEKPVESLVAEPTEESVPVKKHGGGRKPLSAHLPRKRIEYIVPENERRCPCCGEVMPPFGEEISEQLDIIPASYYVIQHVKFKYACAKKCAEKVVTAAGPDKVVDRGLAGPGLLAQSVIVKFGNHLPNFRTEVISDRDGLRIPRSTQCGWQATVASLLEPLYKRMIVYTVLSKKIHTDDTPISVLDPGRGKTKTARFWVYLGDKEHPFTVFDYTPNRKRDGPEKFLKDFKGYLQADAYAGYDQICAGPGVIGVGCWAHARRYFFDAKDTDVRANQLLAMVSEIYAVEALARPSGTGTAGMMRAVIKCGS